jgi:hypothetical protein
MLYGVDYGENIHSFTKVTMTELWSKSVCSGCSVNGAMYVEDDGNVYMTSGWYLYAHGSLLGGQQFSLQLDGSASMPWQFYGSVYVTTSAGTLYCFEPGSYIFQSNKYKIKFQRTTNSSYDIGMPAISPDGMLFFASGSGVFMITYDGVGKFNITSAGSCSSPQVHDGVGYAICESGQIMKLYDIYRGKLWLTSDRGITQYAFYNGSVFYTTYGTKYVKEMSLGSLQLYAPGDLPKPLPERHQSFLEKNKVWIALVIGGIVVIAVIVGVVKACGKGGQKPESDYVAMQTPVNTGGV